MRNKISEKLESDLMSYITLLGSSVFDGITYLTLKNTKDNQATLNTCNKVWESVREDGFSDNVLFRRIYIDSNDVIYDLDLNVCLTLGNKLLAQNLKSLGLGGLDSYVVKINNSTKNIRKVELERLISYIGANLSKESLDIILYNNDKDASVSILGKYKDKEHMLMYNSFRLRHWDLANINDILYQKFGKGIDTLNMCEIIENIGLRVTLTLK